MSTFDGLVKEFPTIRVDYFRNYPDKPAPTALFLSHVHSDHLLGLESVKMPFIYCSGTTKRILLKMEKYPHRINFAKGILEKRRQHYQHLKTILRAIPLDTATEVELGPKSTVQVTLVDANHCPGAVMFLIEGGGKAILYTGDVRAEAWWVNSIVQNPIILPYTCGLQRLDCIYLDTTFATHDEPYREFPTKADGLKELLQNVSRCPPDTIFYFRAWTLGYEQVWLALSNFLQSQVHVNRYQYGLFRDPNDKECAALTGFALGNREHPGCLTVDESARIHSCEPGLSCHTEIKKQKNVVWISPIVSRLKDGTEIRELGAGGGWKDLYPTSQLKLEDSITLPTLLNHLASAATSEDIKAMLMQAVGHFKSMRHFALTLDTTDGVKLQDDDTIKLQEVAALLSKRFSKPASAISQRKAPSRDNGAVPTTTDTIHFPFSRHSSYGELRHLVGTFRPKDVCPCTVELETWSEEVSMEALFGDLCSNHTFHYDEITRELVAEVMQRKGLSFGGRKKRKWDDEEDDSQMTKSEDSRYQDPSSPVVFAAPAEARSSGSQNLPPALERGHEAGEALPSTSSGMAGGDWSEGLDSQPLSSSAFESQVDGHGEPGNREFEDDRHDRSSTSLDRKQSRMAAYNAARVALKTGDLTEWDAIPLSGAGHANHTEHEIELHFR
jgi:DNA cross-link repair 1C protein